MNNLTIDKSENNAPKVEMCKCTIKDGWVKRCIFVDGVKAQKVDIREKMCK